MNRLYIVTTDKKIYSNLVIKYGLTENGNSKWISSLDDIKYIDKPVMILFADSLPLDAMKITDYCKSIHADIFKNVESCDKSLQYIVDNIQAIDQMYSANGIEPKSMISSLKSDMENMGYNNGKGYMYDIRLSNFGNPNSLEYAIIPQSPKAELLCKMIGGYIRSSVLPLRKIKKPVLKGNVLEWE